ncbi:MAG: hypothetical protein DI596_15800 [Azospira oryzae]|nr:MAG: hypothetical protein DI596_15800 [Azospira oryzae]PZP73932.1 MAG: hypothetical protein DI593_15800 [Azospira oryzae]
MKRWYAEKPELFIKVPRNRPGPDTYLYDKALGIKVFADKAFYAVDTSDPKNPQVVPFLLKRDAQAHATRINGKLATYSEALGMMTSPVALATPAGK